MMAATTACSRRWFRQKADEQAYQAIQEKGGHLDRGTIYPKADSRMHDPSAVDCPPMPPDDPNSHQLMRCVDGKQGYQHWDKFGNVGTVEPAFWRQSLPTNTDGEVSLDLKDAVRIARLHSRPYQDNLETLYLSALDVTFERFRFDAQYFAGTGIEQDFRGRQVGARSDTVINSAAGLTKLTASGGELVVGLANSLVWDSWGSGTDLFTSTIDFSLVQPLLRFGGRARVLESLTQSERNLLANVRQMQQFRQGFYVDIATGRSSGPGPSLGNNVGQSGLGLLAGFPSGRNGAPSAGGYLGLLQTQQEIRNQTTNITALRDSLTQLEAAFEANRITSRLQVDQARQALLNAQSSLLAAEASYESRVDAFKVDLGLPPDLPLKIEDTLLDRFILIDPNLTQLQNELAEILVEIRKRRETPTADFIADTLDAIAKLDGRAEQHFTQAHSDLDDFNSRLAERKEQLQRVAKQIDELSADVDGRVYDEAIMLERIDALKKRLPEIGDSLLQNSELRKDLAKQTTSGDEAESDRKEEKEDNADPDDRMAAIKKAIDKSDAEDNTDDADDATSNKQVGSKRAGARMKPQMKMLSKLATDLSDLLLELSLVHAEVRLQGIGLLPIEIKAPEAMNAARLHRLDWMNARANLVDSWRRIEFFANELKSNLDVTVDGELGTRPDNVLDFRNDNSRIRFGIQFDSPLARLGERNRYREALIDYQRARRDYMLFEDSISQSLRNTVRIIKLSQINLEVRRAAVQVAIAQVDIARLRLNPPVKPNQTSRASSPTAARDLVDALGDLLDAQNDLLNVWVSYEVLRVLLDFEMGTMQLSADGDWVDPGQLLLNNSPGLPKGEALGDTLADKNRDAILSDETGILFGDPADAGAMIEVRNDPVVVELVPPELME